MNKYFRPFNKKGVAIETAMFMMIVVFSLCTLLVMFAMISRKQIITSNNEFQTQTHIDQIGEDFCYYVRTYDEASPSEFSCRYPGEYYTLCTRNGNVFTLVLRESGKYTHVLSLVIEKEDAGIIIKRWSQFEGN